MWKVSLICSTISVCSTTYVEEEKKVQRNVEGRKKNHHKQDRVDWQLGEFPSLFFVVVACAYDFGFLS